MKNVRTAKKRWGFRWTEAMRARLVEGARVRWFAVAGRPESAHDCEVRGPARQLADGTWVVALLREDGRYESAAAVSFCQPNTLVDGGSK